MSQCIHGVRLTTYCAECEKLEPPSKPSPGRSMGKVTPWFPVGTFPIRKGWYETKAEWHPHGFSSVMCYWADGWRFDPNGPQTPWPHRKWRGLKSPARAR